MKNTIFAIFALLFVAQSSVAQRFEVNDVDPKTGSKTFITSNHVGADVMWDDTVTRNGMLFFSAGYTSDIKNNTAVETYFIDLSMIHNDARLGCLMHNSGKIIITFTDGTTAECMQVSDNSCDKLAFNAGYALMPRGDYTNKMRQTFDNLLVKDIKSIEVFTSETTIKYPIKSQKMDYIKAHFALLDKRIKQSKPAQGTASN